MPDDLQGLVSRALGKNEAPSGPVSGFSNYVPQETPEDTTNFLYSPPVQQFNPGPAQPVAPPLKPLQTNNWQDWIEKNVFVPAFGSYQSPEKNIPGRENIFKAGKAEAQQFIHDMSTLGASGLQHLNRINPILDPSKGYKPEFGKPLSPVTQEDIEYLEKAAPHILGYQLERYGRPALHEKDYIKDVLAPYLQNQPIQTGLDILGVVAPALEPFGHLKGAVSRTSQFNKLNKAVKNIGQGAKVAGVQAITKLPIIGADIWATNAVRGIIGKLSAQELQSLRATESKLITALSKIDPAERDLIPAALERTDPQLDYLLSKPVVQNYAALQEKYAQQSWNALLKHKLVNKEDWLATRVFPQFAAAVKRGEIDFPVMDLRTSDVYTNPELQKVLVAYARQQAQTIGKKAFAGRYNPVTFKNDIANYQRGKLPEGKALERATAAQREAAKIRTEEIAGKEITSLRGPEHSMDAALNMSRKLDLTARLLKLYDSLEDAQAVLETLPSQVRILASRKLDSLLYPLLREAGITKESLESMERFSLWASEQNKKLNFRDSIEKGLNTAKEGFEASLKTAEFFASIQRQLSILGDFAWPHLLHFQQWLIYFGTGLSDKNIMNFLIAAKLAQDERIFSRIPREFLEHRGRIEYKNPALSLTNPLMQLLSDYAQAGYDAANRVRGSASILQMLDEYDKLHPFIQGKVLKQLKNQFDIESRLRAFLQTKRAIEGGIKVAGKRKPIAKMGQSAGQMEKLTQDIIKHNRDVYGHYQGPYNTAMRLARATSIWANMTKHAITLTARMALENPEKLTLLRAAAQQVGAQQIMDAKKAGIPDWAIKLGVVPSGKTAPNGYVQVQFDSGFNLLLESLRAGLSLADLIDRFGSPDEAMDMGNPIDAQLNFLVSAAEIYAGWMPYGHRPLVNPYQGKVENVQYNLLKMANKYRTGLPSRKQMEKDMVKTPYDKFVQRVVISAGLGFSPKKWNYLKRLDGFIRGYEPSDLTIPFVPGMEYPKVDMKHGRLRPAQAESPLEFIPGAHRINEQRLKQKEAYPKSRDYYRKRQLSNEMKARLKYLPLVPLLRSKEVSSRLLPKY